MSQTYYFKSCCPGLPPFGIPNNSKPFTPFLGFTDTVGTEYAVSIINDKIGVIYEGCVTYSGATLNNTTDPNVSTIYNGTPTFSSFSCKDCMEYVYPCFTPPPSPIPPTIVGYKNECGIITILPMGITCVTSNPTTSGSYDGEVSVIITGGTPPYTTTWVWPNNTSQSPAIQGLGNGSYSATTVDYWGDFTATTVCYINVAPDCRFDATIVEQDIDNCLPTAMSGYTFDLT